MANMTFKASLLPNTDLGYSLGSANKRWKIYGTHYQQFDKLTSDTNSEYNITTYIIKLINDGFDGGWFWCQASSGKGCPTTSDDDGYQITWQCNTKNGNGVNLTAVLYGNNINTTYNGFLWKNSTNLPTWRQIFQVNMGSASSLTSCDSVNASGAFTYDNFTNRPTGVRNWGTLVNYRLYLNNNLYHRQVFYDCYESNRLWVRGCNGGTWNSWDEIVRNTGTWDISITGNAATATKLQTARTLWGQSFNGTANVSGNMTDVGPNMKLPSSETRFKFLTSGNGAAEGTYKSIGLADSYSNVDLSTYRLHVYGGTVGITNNSNTVTIGSLNASYCHFQNSADIPFYFNKHVWVDGNVYPYGTTNTKTLGTTTKYWQLGYITRIVGSADTLTTGRTIQVNLASSSAPSFNGSANITPGVTGILPIANGGTAANNVATAKSNLKVYRKTDNLTASGSTHTVVSYVKALVNAGQQDGWFMMEGKSGRGLPDNSNWWEVEFHAANDLGNGVQLYCHLYGGINYYSGSMWRNAADTATPTWKYLWQQGDNVTGAVWNDYAEYRESEETDFGYIVQETGKDSLQKTTTRLSHFAGVTSDTWGFAQGETEKAKTPIAVAGRVLVYPGEDRNKYKPGDCVCAGPDGKAYRMFWWEKIFFPDRIVGTVSCVPEYEEWGGSDNKPPVKINGRIWIKVK